MKIFSSVGVIFSVVLICWWRYHSELLIVYILYS